MTLVILRTYHRYYGYVVKKYHRLIERNKRGNKKVEILADAFTINGFFDCGNRRFILSREKMYDNNPIDN